MLASIIYPKFRAEDDNGNPLSGGKLYVYEQGTSTLASIYTDIDGSVAGTNPTILNSRGETSMYLSDGVYKLRLFDENDVEIWTQDGFVVSADDQSSITCANMEALLIVPQTGYMRTAGFYEQGDGGGTLFYWDATRDKTNHNGGTVIDPATTVTPGASGWWTTTSSSGTGCWVAMNDSAVCPEQFGAKCDDVVDDAVPAEEAAKLGGRLVLNPRTYCWKTNPVIPTETQLAVFGWGATIKLTGSAVTAWNLRGDDITKTFKNLRFEGFNVDANNQANVGQEGAILSSFDESTGNLGINANLDGLYVADIICTNLVEAAYDLSTNGSAGIALGSTTTASLITLENITIERVKIFGGRSGITITRQGIDPTNTNFYANNIVIRDCDHEISEAKSGYYSSANFMVGGGGLCGNVKIENCNGQYSGDVGVELDGVENGVIENCTIKDAYNVPYYITNYAAPTNRERQKITLSNIKSFTANSTHVGPAVKVYNYDSSYMVHECVVDGIVVNISGVTDTYLSGQIVQAVCDIFTGNDFRITFDGLNDESGAFRFVKVRAQDISLRNVDFDITFSTANASDCSARPIVLEDFSKAKVENIAITADLNSGNTSTGIVSNLIPVTIGTIGSTTYESYDLIKIDGLFVECSDTTSTQYCVYFNAAYQELIGRCVVQNVDITGLANPLSDVWPGISGAAYEQSWATNLRIENCAYPAGEGNSFSVTVDGAPEIIKNNKFRPIVGYFDSTNVNQLRVSRDWGTTWINTNMTAGQLIIQPGEQLEITEVATYTQDFYFKEVP